MLDDHAHRQSELARDQSRRREIVEVVERERLAVQLLDARQQVRARAALGIIRRALMRVLAVGEVEHLVERDDERLGECLTLGEPRRDRSFVRCGCRERLGCELSPRLE